MSELLVALREKSQFLSYDERAYLAQELMESMQHDASSDIETAWDAALKERTTAYAQGLADLVPAELVFARAKQLTA